MFLILTRALENHSMNCSFIKLAATLVSSFFVFGRRRIWIILFRVIREKNTATILHNKTNKSKCKNTSC